MGRRPSSVQPRSLILLGALLVGTVIVRKVAGTELAHTVGLLVAALAILLIRSAQRWNREALTAMSKRGPKYDARQLLREQRERMLKRGRAQETPEERK